MAVGGEVGTLAVLFAVVPITFVLAAIWPEELSISFLFVILILANVFAAVSPRESASAVHFILAPLSVVDPAVLPRVDPFSVDLIIIELSNVRRIVCPLEVTDAVLLSIFESAFVTSIVRPGFDAESMLTVLSPVSNILCAVGVLVKSSPMCLVVFPLALVDVAVSMDESTFAVSLIVSPIAHVLAAILPDLDALALSSAVLGPLAVEDCSIVHFERPLVDQIKRETLGLAAVELEHSEPCLGGPSGKIGVIRHFLEFPSEAAVGQRLALAEYVTAWNFFPTAVGLILLLHDVFQKLVDFTLQESTNNRLQFQDFLFVFLGDGHGVLELVVCVVGSCSVLLDAFGVVIILGVLVLWLVAAAQLIVSHCFS